MANVAIQPIPVTGVQPTMAAASPGGDTVRPGPGTFLFVSNASASPVDVTLVTPGAVDGLAVADRVVTVPAGEMHAIAVTQLYRDPADGLAHITWSSPTSVTFAALRAS